MSQLLTPEAVHIEVAHQERYQLRKQIRLIKAHRTGAHKTTPYHTCNECLAATAPLQPKALLVPNTTEVAKNATA
jgi:hypothetical protein